MEENIYNELLKIIPKESIYINEPMSKHTSFKIGGPADFFIKIKSIEELKHTLFVAKSTKTPVVIIGNGTNLLVKDKGIRGIVIQLKLDEIKFDDEYVQVGAGVLLSKISREAYEKSLAGLEFAIGIPGTIGGAITMNAGAYGNEFKSVVEHTTYIDKELNIKTITNKEHEFGNRTSIFKENNDYIILGSKLKLTRGNKEEIKNKIDENTAKRTQTQPRDYPNAGSIFKRGEGFIPAQLIDKCGLKGYNIGDACVSEKHAGFIVNKGKATAKDVMKLIEYIQKAVKEKYNVDIETEIEIIGE